MSALPRPTIGAPRRPMTADAGLRALPRPSREPTAWALTAAGLVGLSLLTRLPGALRPWFDRDEAHIALQGQAILRGERLYTQVIDRKPPLVPAIYAAVQAWVGTDLRPVRVVAALSVAATALVVAAIARQLGVSRTAAAVGGVLYVLGSVTFFPRDAQAANFELWAALPAAAAVWLALRGADRHRSTWFVAAGALVGIAACTKQPFVLTGVPVAVAAWSRPQRLRALVAAAAGAAASFSAVGAVFGLPGMVRWAWTENGGYMIGSRGVVTIAGIAAGTTALFVVGHAPSVWLAARALRRHRPVSVVVVAWGLAALVGIAGGLKFLGHYDIQVLAPLCVLAALGADTVRVGVRRAAVGAGIVLAGVAVLAAVSPLAPTPMRQDALQAAIARNTAPGDRILVWGAAPEIPLEADRPIAGGFVHDGFLTGMWSSDPASGSGRWPAFLADVRADRPRLVVDTSPRGVGGFDEYPMSATPLAPYVARHYRRIGRFSGMDVWIRNPAGSTSPT